MPRIATGLALVGLVFALTVGAAAPASAEFFGCDDQHPQRAVGYACAPPDTRVSPFTHEFAAQSRRPRITIYPRRVHPGRNATRQCRSWLVKEYRVSGPVIVPKMRCWWE